MNEVPKDKDSLVLVGRISSIFGVKGWVNVFSYTDPAENMLSYSNWLLYPSEGDGQGTRDFVPSLAECKQVKLSDGQRHGKRIIAQLNGNESREKAISFVQHDVFIRRSELPALDDDVYWIELEGLEVINLQNQVLGKVVKMLETGANDVIVVASENSSSTEKQEDILIPYVEDHFVIEVDLREGRIIVDWSIDDSEV